jgi:hypothetical protein
MRQVATYLELELGNFMKLGAGTAQKAIRFYRMRARSGALVG